MDQLLSTLLAAGAPSAVALVLLVRIMIGDRRTDRRLDAYSRSLEARIVQLEAWKDAATSALVAAGVPVPTVISVPSPHLSPERLT